MSIVEGMMSCPWINWTKENNNEKVDAVNIAKRTFQRIEECAITER